MKGVLIIMEKKINTTNEEEVMEPALVDGKPMEKLSIKARAAGFVKRNWKVVLGTVLLALAGGAAAYYKSKHDGEGCMSDVDVLSEDTTEITLED